MDSLFLNVKFTEITLLHILILVGIPYIIFYFFERYTKFDKFFEKWEGALFIFVMGGIITSISIFLQDLFNLPFWITYLLLIVLLSLILWIIKLIYFNKKSYNLDKWVLIKLKNGERFKGKIIRQTSNFISLGRDHNNKISKLIGKKEEKELAWNIIHFNISEIVSIYCINPDH